MVAQVMTGGSLDFGSTPKDNYNTGIVLLSFGSALFLPQICICALCFREWLQARYRRRYHLDLDNAVEVDSPTDSSVAIGSAGTGSRHMASIARYEMRRVRDLCSPADSIAQVQSTRRASPKPQLGIAETHFATDHV